MDSYPKHRGGRVPRKLKKRIQAATLRWALHMYELAAEGPRGSTFLNQQVRENLAKAAHHGG